MIVAGKWCCTTGGKTTGTQLPDYDFSRNVCLVCLMEENHLTANCLDRMCNQARKKMKIPQSQAQNWKSAWYVVLDTLWAYRKGIPIECLSATKHKLVLHHTPGDCWLQRWDSSVFLRFCSSSCYVTVCCSCRSCWCRATWRAPSPPSRDATASPAGSPASWLRSTKSVHVSTCFCHACCLHIYSLHLSSVYMYVFFKCSIVFPECDDTRMAMHWNSSRYISPGSCWQNLWSVVKPSAWNYRLWLQVGNTVLIVFVSFFGSRVHRPRFIGGGALLASLASLLMAIPHFLSGPYDYTDRISCETKHEQSKQLALPLIPI